MSRRPSILLMVKAVALLLTTMVLDCPSHLRADDGDTWNKPPNGFVALFNGTDLSGWFGHATEDPRLLWAMSKDKLAAHQEKTLDDIHQHWSVDRGELVNDGHGLYLTTLKDYADFELLLEYKAVPAADSGIYLRGVPQVQIWDRAEGSGGLWNNSGGAPGKEPLKKMDKPMGQWNALRILMIGERVSVWLNDAKVVDHARMENYYDRKIPVFKTGPIQLQTHGGEIRWRNVFIREIEPEEANRILQAREDAGFFSLFNGVDLAGWQGAVDAYTVQHGTILCKEGAGGQLFAEDEYGDFAFRFEFKLPPGGNNGVGVRAPLTGDPAWEGFEIQILDNTAEKYANLKPNQFHGSVYGAVPAKRGFLRAIGQWNYQEIRFLGSHITVELNGYTILDKDLKEVDQSRLERRAKGFDRTTGHIGFCGHGDVVQLRNIRIKNMPGAFLEK
ncbi:MAG: DUF1080 domain-containing protein [Pirellulales bacterium]|nr:DUF1080 domain-containing protein [Pirellulales bacterium]